MVTNGNLEAHLAALLFLGSGGLLLLLLAATIAAFFWKREWVRYLLGAAAAVILGYAGLLGVFSLFSSERTLARGEEKHFCELDCHIAYSVEEVQRVKSIGGATATGEFYVIRVRSRFDESTISKSRPREVPLIPSALSAAIVDGAGSEHAVSSTGQGAWDAAHGSEHSMRDCLRPGESYETTLVFDVPANASAPRLLLRARGEPSGLLIGDEESPGHSKAYLAL